MDDSSILKTDPGQDLFQHGMSSNAVLITLSLLLLWGGRISYIFVKEGLKDWTFDSTQTESKSVNNLFDYVMWQLVSGFCTCLESNPGNSLCCLILVLAY